MSNEAEAEQGEASQDAGVNETTEEATGTEEAAADTDKEPESVAEGAGAEGTGGILEELQVAPQILLIAAACHGINRAYCQSMGDESLLPWDESPIWQRNSVINGVVLHLEQDITPEQSHENWLATKDAQGWVYGDEKNEVAKTHPNIMPYDDLPDAEKAKDHLFKATVDQMAGVTDIYDSQITEASNELLAAGTKIADLVTEAEELKATAGNKGWTTVLKSLVDGGVVTKEELYTRLSVSQIEVMEAV